MHERNIELKYLLKNQNQNYNQLDIKCWSVVWAKIQRYPYHFVLHYTAWACAHVHFLSKGNFLISFGKKVAKASPFLEYAKKKS